MFTVKFESVERVATAMKVGGAVLLGVALVPIGAFSALLLGCSISAAAAAHSGDRTGVIVNTAFAAANALGVARTIGLLT